MRTRAQCVDPMGGNRLCALVFEESWLSASLLKCGPCRLKGSEIKSFTARGIEDEFLGFLHLEDRGLQRVNNVSRDHNRAMPVSVDQVASTNVHAHDADGLVDAAHMNKAVAWADVACDDGEVFGHIAKVAHHAVGKSARHAKTLVDRRVHLAPIGADAIGVVDVFDGGD